MAERHKPEEDITTVLERLEADAHILGATAVAYVGYIKKSPPEENILRAIADGFHEQAEIVAQRQG